MNATESIKQFDSFGKSFTLDEAREDVHAFIRKIYDELKNRTCENCSNYLPNISEYGEYEGECSFDIVQERDLDTVKITFGCNEFEAKTVSTDTKGEEYV